MSRWPRRAKRVSTHEAAAADAAKAFRRYLAASAMKPGTNRHYIDHGTGTIDGSYGPYAAALVKVLHGAGWSAPQLVIRIFAGAEHIETARARRVDIPLAFLDARDP